MTKLIQLRLAAVDGLLVIEQRDREGRPPPLGGKNLAPDPRKETPELIYPSCRDRNRDRELQVSYRSERSYNATGDPQSRDRRVWHRTPGMGGHVS